MVEESTTFRTMGSSCLQTIIMGLFILSSVAHCLGPEENQNKFIRARMGDLLQRFKDYFESFGDVDFDNMHHIFMDYKESGSDDLEYDIPLTLDNKTDSMNFDFSVPEYEDAKTDMNISLSEYRYPVDDDEFQQNWSPSKDFNNNDNPDSNHNDVIENPAADTLRGYRNNEQQSNRVPIRIDLSGESLGSDFLEPQNKSADVSKLLHLSLAEIQKILDNSNDSDIPSPTTPEPTGGVLEENMRLNGVKNGINIPNKPRPPIPVFSRSAGDVLAKGTIGSISSSFGDKNLNLDVQGADTYKVLNRVDGIWTDDQSNSKDETIGHLLDSILPLQRNRLYAHRGRSLSLPIILPSARQTLDSIEEDSQLYTESNTESSEGVYRVLHEYLGRNPEDSNVVPVPVPTVVDAKKTNVYRTPADQNEQIYNVRSNIYSTLNE
eukprot:244770_1